MCRMRPLALILFLAALCAAPAAAQDVADPLSGVWKGDIITPRGPLGFVAYFEADREGGWTGSADTPTQSAYGIPWSAVELDGRRLVARLELTGAVYEAELTDDGKTLKGVWKQSGAEMRLVCTRQPTPPGVPEILAGQLVGTWEGVLDVGAIQLRLVLVLERSPAGTVRGHMVSPDQSPDEIPVGRVDFVEGRRVRIRVGMIATTFDVEIVEDGDSFAGKFRQGFQTFDISMKKVEAPTEVRRPQEPKPPFPYRSEEVVYRKEHGDVTLAGTLTLPEGDGPFPAALLITGSGGQNRDEEIFQHKPFWVIADHLTRRGIAALRVDDRGIGGSSAGPAPGTATTFDFAGDVEAGVAFLESRDEIAKDRIGLIGHSEGGVIAPIVAARNPDVAFIVLLAGTGIRGTELLVRQAELFMRASGFEEERIATSTRTQRAIFEVVLDESLDPDEAQAGIRELIEANPEYVAATEEEQETSLKTALSQLSTPWLQTFARYDPAPTLEQVRCPVLALNGALDLQVPCTVNLDAITAALEKGRNPDFTVKAFPGLNHLFQHCETGLVSEYGQIEETCAVEVLDTITDWIAVRFLTTD